MCRFSRSFIAEKNLVDHKKQGISHQITVSFISPNAEPHVHEPRKAGSSHQMISYRDPGPLGIKTVDIQEVGRFLTPSRSHTIVQERSDTFSHSCTFHRHTVLDFFPRWCTSMQQPTTTPQRYLFLGSTRYYTIFWVFIRYIRYTILSHDICNISDLVKIARTLQEMRH